MMKFLCACVLSLLIILPLYAETKLEKRAAVMRYFANLSSEVDALKSKPNLTLEEMKELNKKERLLLEFQGKLLDSLEPVENPEIVMEIPIPKNKNKQSLTEYENFTAEQKAYLENQERIIADLERQVNERKAKQGIQTSQDTQSGDTMSEVKYFDFNEARKKFSDDEIVDYLRNTAITNINWDFYKNYNNKQIVDRLSAYADKLEIYDTGFNQETSREQKQEINTYYDPNYANAIANYSDEERETFWRLIKVLQDSEEVLSMLKQESGFWSWFDRRLDKWTKGIWGLNRNQVTFNIKAYDIRTTIYEHKFWMIKDKYDHKDSKLLYGVDGIASFATNIGTMKRILDDTLREVYLMNLPTTKKQKKAIETAEQNLAYLKSLKSPDEYNESAIIKNDYIFDEQTP